jgi:hypothetical protein
MARLSAHGRELARVHKTTHNPTEGIIERTTTIVLMEDRRMLKKYTVVFAPDDYNPKPQHHDYGWKLDKKVKKGVTPQQFVNAYAKVGFTT